MKKILLLSITILTLMFSGCNLSTTFKPQENTHKSCKLEVLSAKDNTLITTVDEQETINNLINIENWELAPNETKDLNEQYNIIVYQEKTRLYGESENKEKEYEVIENITTYDDCSYAKITISPDVIKNKSVPEEYLTLFYTIPDETIDNLEQIISK